MRLPVIIRTSGVYQSGTTLLETVVALAVLGTISVTFLGGVVSTSRSALIVDEQATALGLAQSQMEWAQDATYSSNTSQYTPAPLPVDSEYDNYSVNITARSLNYPDDGIQKITITVNRSDEEILSLEGYKVNR